MIIALKIIAIPLIVLFVLFSTKRLAEKIESSLYKYENKKYLKMREECRKAQEKEVKQGAIIYGLHSKEPKITYRCNLISEYTHKAVILR